MSLLFSTGSIAASGLAPVTAGLVLIKPTSISHTGTSATLGANGQVTFSVVSALSVNGVFSADFDNYMISIRHSSSGNPVITGRLRASGTDASGSDYSHVRMRADGSTADLSAVTVETGFRAGMSSSTARSGDTLHIYGPYLAQKTAFRNVNVRGLSDAYIMDIPQTHALTTSYDGFSLLPDGGSSDMTGALQVYGIRS